MGRELFGPHGVITLDVPCTFAVVVLSTAVLLGDLATNPKYTQQQQHGGAHFSSPLCSRFACCLLAFCSTLCSNFCSGRGLQDAWVEQPPPGGYASTDDDAAGAGGPPAGPAALPPPGAHWALEGAFEETVGNGLNAWVFTCYPHQYYSTFSMAFLPRMFVWGFGHTGFEEYKVNMLFMLVVSSTAICRCL